MIIRWSLRTLHVFLLTVPVLAQAAGTRLSELDNKRLAAIAKSSPEAALRIARMDGKYRMLLHQLRNHESRKEWISEVGFRDAQKYRGEDVLAGYWVYVQPYWFVFAERGPRRPPRYWGPEQMLGEPNATLDEDSETAWSARIQDSPLTEWVMVEFENPIDATAIEIHESFHAGAVGKVSIFRGGNETIVRNANQWKPRPAGVTRVDLNGTVGRIKIYLETSRVNGWNQIDAIGLVDREGRKHWATSAVASSTSAVPYGPIVGKVRPQTSARTGRTSAPTKVAAARDLTQLAHEFDRLSTEMKAEIRRLEVENRSLRQDLRRVERSVREARGGRRW